MHCLFIVYLLLIYCLFIGKVSLFAAVTKPLFFSHPIVSLPRIRLMHKIVVFNFNVHEYSFGRTFLHWCFIVFLLWCGSYCIHHILYCIVLCCNVLCCVVVLYCIVLCCIVLCSIVLYFVVLLLVLYCVVVVVVVGTVYCNIFMFTVWWCCYIIFQTSGEAEFVGDMPALVGQLHAAFVKSTKASAVLTKVDCSEALSMPGVVRYVNEIT